MRVVRPGIVVLAVLLLLLSSVGPTRGRGPIEVKHDFERDRPGECPAGWTISAPSEGQTTAEVTRSGPASGRKCVRIVQRGAELGSLNRFLDDVRRFAGKRVRLRASVRTRGMATGRGVQLWLRIDAADNEILLMDDQSGLLLRPDRWERLEITAAVPDDAKVIYLGLGVTGPGEAWLDDVSLTVVGDVDPTAVRDGIAVVAVKDFMRIESTGDAVEGLEFPRYFPSIDAEQIVLGRWVTARTDDGKPVPIGIADVSSDSLDNLVHTWRIGRFPARSGVVVTVTSLVLRRERPAPRGRFAILVPEAYPDAVRPYLRSTACVVVDHPAIRAVAAGILEKTEDAFEVAAAVAALMRENTYEQRGTPEEGLPTSVAVLRHGGSCCGSAVCAAAILRACGIPTQITYCPAGYIHGIVRFWLDGYGWCRMDATCGTGRLPLVGDDTHRGLVRLYDMPIEMERLRIHPYAWPFQHNTEDGEYRFTRDGEAVPWIRFAARDEADAWRDGRISGRVHEPFRHLEPGSWHRVLGIEPWAIGDVRWGKLVSASRAATRTDRSGPFPEVVRLLRPHAGPSWLEDRVRAVALYGELPRTR